MVANTNANGATPGAPGASPAATTPQQFQPMMQQASHPGQQRPPDGRGSTPPDRKRQRRNSGSAAASPFIQPQVLQAGFQPQNSGQQGQMMMGMQMGQRQVSLGGTPMESHSPAQQGQQMPGQSPRNVSISGLPGQTMQRNQSKSGGGEGSMLPPQSPAQLGGRTPQAGKMSMTPKMQNKEELMVSLFFHDVLADSSVRHSEVASQLPPAGHRRR